MDTKDITKHLRTWIEIDTKAIDQNLALARSILPETTQIMAVVKSNAYGHGLFDFASYVANHPTGAVSWIAVDSITEAVALRKDGIMLPMLVMGYSLAERFAEAAEHDISITISNMTALQESIDFSVESQKKLKIHIKIDTGLHRQGFLLDEVPALLEILQKNKELLHIEGLYTHLADAKREEGVDYSQQQKKIFGDVREQFAQAGFKLISHISASPAVLRFGAKWLAGENMVRLGAILYGMYPSDHMENEYQKNFPLHPELSWKTVISELKKIPAGSSVGYNRSESVLRETRIGICPIGYWHGYPGALSSRGVVLVQCGSNGRASKGDQDSKTPAVFAAKVLGRVSMDMITIDCTDCPDVQIGDEVILVDSNPKSVALARLVAEKAGISVHELLTRLNPKIKRIFV